MAIDQSITLLLDDLNLSLKEAQKRIEYVAKLDAIIRAELAVVTNWYDLPASTIAVALSLSFGDYTLEKKHPAYDKEMYYLSDIAVVYTKYGLIPIMKYSIVSRSDAVHKQALKKLYIRKEKLIDKDKTHAMSDSLRSFLGRFDIEMPIFASTVDIHKAASQIAEIQDKNKFFHISNNVSQDYLSGEQIRDWILKCFEKQYQPSQLFKGYIEYSFWEDGYRSKEMQLQTESDVDELYKKCGSCPGTKVFFHSDKTKKKFYPV